MVSVPISIENEMAGTGHGGRSVNETHVVFGAAGSLGAAIVQRLSAEGRPVRAVVRDAGRAKQVLPRSAELVVGDALNSDHVRALCKDAGTVYHCVNVPYRDWLEVHPKVTKNILAGATEAKATLVFPGNVYGYGPFQKIPATEDHPLAAASRKGHLRNELEAMLRDADKAGRVRVVIPRFPDFYGPNVTNRLFAPIFEGAIAGKRARWIGNLDVAHDFVFIDDAAAASIMLGRVEEVPGQVWHVPGPGPLTGREFIEMAFKIAGTRPRVGVMGGGLILFASLFSSDAREVRELLYQFEQPMVLGGTKFARAFPSFTYTPREESIRRTIDWFRQHSKA